MCYILLVFLVSSMWVMAQQGSSCYAPILFQWEQVYVQDAGTTKWYCVQLDPALHRNKEFVLTLTNLTDAGTRVQATPYFSCDSEPIADESNTLMAYQTKTTRMEAGMVNYVLDSSGGLVLLKLTTTGTIEFSSTVQTPIERPENPACLSAEPIYPTSYYVLRTTDENWFTYQFTGRDYLRWVFHPDNPDEVATKEFTLYENCDASPVTSYVTEANSYDGMAVPLAGTYYLQISTTGAGYIEFLSDTARNMCGSSLPIYPGETYRVVDSAYYHYQPADDAITTMYVAEQTRLLIYKGFCGDACELLYDTVMATNELDCQVLPALPPGQAYYIRIKGSTDFMIDNHGGDCRNAYEITEDTTVFPITTVPTWFTLDANGSQTVDLYFQPDDPDAVNSLKTVELFKSCDVEPTLRVSRGIDTVRGFFIIPEGRYYVKYTGTVDGVGTCVLRDTLVHKHHYIDTTFCEGDGLVIADTTLTESGEYIDVCIRNNGYYYDIYHYHITVTPAPQSQQYLLVKEEDLPLVVHDVTIEGEGEYVLHYPMEEGCDSLVYLTVELKKDTLSFVDLVYDRPYLLTDSSTVFRLYNTTQPDSLHVVWRADRMEEDYLPEVQIRYADYKGQMVQNGKPRSENGVYVVDRFWQESAWLNEDTLFIRLLPPQWGSVTFKPIVYAHDTVYATICEGSAYELPDTMLTKEGEYIDTLNVMGGYRFEVMHYFIDVTPAPHMQDTLYLAASEIPFEYDGLQILSSGKYILDYQTPEGCDSILHLRVYVQPEEPEEPEKEEGYDAPELSPTLAKAGTPLTLQLPDNLRVWTIRLFDTSGRLVRVWNNVEDRKGEKMMLTLEAAGYYILQVETSMYCWKTPLILY